ncbi:MAG: hypothetical protein JWO74_3136 [Solirubrobacterales bacterium]|nr:hypothetical protein [Solirubrobacterales bacterium]
MTTVAPMPIFGSPDQRLLQLTALAERFPDGQAVSEEEARRLLLRCAVPRAYLDHELMSLVERGMLRRQEDGTYARPLPRREPEPTTATQGDNPEFAGFRTAVLTILDEWARSRGLVS